MPASPHIDVRDPATAGTLPMHYELELRRVFGTRADGGRLLIEQLLASDGPVELNLPTSGKTLLLSFDRNTATLEVRDPGGTDDHVWHWRRLRRLVLRDTLLRSLGQRAGTAGELPSWISRALRYPRPRLSGIAEIPALAQLAERCDARLKISETVTFDRYAVPATPDRAPLDQAALRNDVQANLSALTTDQTVAVVQEAVFENPTATKTAVAFPTEARDDLLALVRHANPPARVSVSLALPVKAGLTVDLGPNHDEETFDVEAILLFLELQPEDVMAVIRENTLTGPAESILEENGLSLLSLSIREARLK